MVGLYRRKYWAYILFHILAIPAVLGLVFFAYTGYLNDEPMSGVYWLALFLAIGLLGLSIRMKKRLFRSGDAYSRSKGYSRDESYSRSEGYSQKEVFYIFAGLAVVAGLFYLLFIR